ncbi:MAG TPA: SusD/RagB family nutrient-binding outer membrane lipoprotein, partial [Chitinophagaceae bacterium]
MKMKLCMILIAMAAVTVSSCKKQLDINKDPDNPSLDQLTPKLVFPAAVVSSAGRIGGDLAIVGGIWAQFYTQNTTSNQYKNIDAFDLTKSDFGSTLISSPWAELYSGALNDLHFTIRRAQQENDHTYVLVGTVIKAFTMQMLVDLYDQVPYSEAFQGINNLQPKFDDGYSVYKALLQELDAALAGNFEASTNSSPGAYDLLWPGTGPTVEAQEADWVSNGNLQKWVSFANTLKLKMYLRMVYAKPTEAEAGIRAMYNAGVQFLNEDAKLDVFENAENKSNPLFEFNNRKLNTDANLKASVTFLSWLQTNGDPRIDNYMLPRTGSTTQYLGIHQGDFLNPDPTFNNASKANISPVDPVDFISKAESHFLQAEALERYYAGAGAQAQYEQGVRASFARYGDNPNTLLAGLYAYPAAATFEQKLEAIITQKWASMPKS